MRTNQRNPGEPWSLLGRGSSRCSHVTGCSRDNLSAPRRVPHTSHPARADGEQPPHALCAASLRFTQTRSSAIFWLNMPNRNYFLHLLTCFPLGTFFQFIHWQRMTLGSLGSCHQDINSNTWSSFRLDITSLPWLTTFEDSELWALSSVSVVTHYVSLKPYNYNMDEQFLDRKFGGLFKCPKL